MTIAMIADLFKIRHMIQDSRKHLIVIVFYKTMNSLNAVDFLLYPIFIIL